MDWHEFFTVEGLFFSLPVVVIGSFMMRLLYVSLINAMMPCKDMVESGNYKIGWIEEERRLLECRRGEERRAKARQAYLAGDMSALSEIGRRKSDFDAVGLPFPMAA